MLRDGEIALGSVRRYADQKDREYEKYFSGSLRSLRDFHLEY